MMATTEVLAGKIFERSKTPFWKDVFEGCVRLSVDSRSILKLLARLDAVLYLRAQFLTAVLMSDAANCVRQQALLQKVPRVQIYDD